MESRDLSLTKKLAKWFFISLVLLFFLKILSLVVIRNNFYQWDFKMFYFAGKAHAQGLNPYSLTVLNEVSNSKIRFRFRYPPLTLWFFRLLARFDFQTAYLLFLSLKCLLLGALLFLWIHYFLKEESDIWFIVFSLLAFNTAIFIDIVSGNVSILEQFGLWLAFIFLIKKRLLLFSLLVLITAQFKIPPLFFLILLVFNRHRKRYHYLFGTLLAFLLIQGISYLTSPLYKEFLVYGFEFEKYMQSSYTLLSDVLTICGRLFGLGFAASLIKGFFVAFVVLVMTLSWKGATRLKDYFAHHEAEGYRLIIYLACLCYALIVPRFLAYSHMILIVPTYYAIKRLLAGKEGGLMFILAILQMPAMSGMPGMEVPLDLVWKYHSVIIAFGVWMLFLYRIAQDKKGQFKLVDLPA